MKSTIREYQRQRDFGEGDRERENLRHYISLLGECQLFVEMWQRRMKWMETGSEGIDRNEESRMKQRQETK